MNTQVSLENPKHTTIKHTVVERETHIKAKRLSEEMLKALRKAVFEMNQHSLHLDEQTETWMIIPKTESIPVFPKDKLPSNAHVVPLSPRIVKKNI